MKVRTLILGVALAIIGLPALFVLILLASVHFLNRTNGSMISSGEKRQYLLYVPKSCDGANPAPLVISLHGAGGWPAQQRNTTRWNRVADEQGIIVVYPSGTGTPRIWPMEGEALARDVRFISELIDQLEATYNIDRARIYADGLSNGGGMAFALSCTMSDRIAAVGMVAAAQLLPWGWCPDSRPVPMIAFHRTADPIVPYDGGTTWKTPTRRPFPSVPQWVANWAGRNGCDPAPVDTQVATHVSRRVYPGCAAGAEVVFYTIQGGGHSWPGGKPLPGWWVGPTSREVDATRLMWDFFREHPLTGTRAAGQKP